MYTTEVEKREGLVAQGPLLVILLLELLRINVIDRSATDIPQDTSEPQLTLKHFQYTVFKPVYVDSQIKLCGRYLPLAKDKSTYQLWISDSLGELKMRGTAHLQEVVKNPSQTESSQILQEDTMTEEELAS